MQFASYISNGDMNNLCRGPQTNVKYNNIF